MSVRNLDLLFHPKSVAVIGASAHAGTVGNITLSNIISGGFEGEVQGVNPHAIDISGVHCVASVGELPVAPDLAIVAVPADAVPATISELGALGTRIVVVISAGLTRDNGLRQAMLDAARPHLLRIIGPNCVGIQLPHAKLNGSFAHVMAKPGKLALISQSGALVTAILDWATRRDIGFSGVVSVGDMADVDLGDLIDLFANDPHSDAILLYVEGVTNTAKFMSAARAASRIKPVIAIKAGRSAAANRAVMSHTGALAGSYDVYMAAFRRAGIIIVDTLSELFDAAETLCRTRTVDGDRLAILTNGGGGGILAVDALARTKGKLATLSGTTMNTLEASLPPSWSHGNPVDVIGDAHADRYRAAIAPLLDDPGVDALLVMNCPTALSSSSEIAVSVADAVIAARRAGNHKPVLACWLGDSNCEKAQAIFAEAEIPLYTAPEDAVRGFEFLLAAREARTTLLKTPSLDEVRNVDRKISPSIIEAARRDGRTMLDEVEAKKLLSAYGIPVVPTELAESLDVVERTCAKVPAPYALKIVSPDIVHKSDVGGVKLNLGDATATAEAAKAMLEKISHEHSTARIKGFAIEAMCIRPHAQELIVGIADDPTFGPLLMVGAGGKAVEMLNDKALAIPPLDREGALTLIDQTRVARLLHGYRDEPKLNIEAAAAALTALSAMVADLPDIVELDINPLLVDADGAIALDARVRITEERYPKSRMVIRPIPAQWTADLITRSGDRLHVRPVEPTDEDRLAEFFRHVTAEDLNYRFLTGVREVSHERIAAMTQIDYFRTMTFLAFGNDQDDVVAVATVAADPDHLRAEVAISVHSDWKGHGVSWTLLEHVIRYAEAEGIAVLESLESAANEPAISLEREMGFVARECPGDPTLRIVRKTLRPFPGDIEAMA